MKLRTFVFVAAACALPTAVLAQPAANSPDALTQAEQAYQEVDFDVAYEHALAAMRAGTSNVFETARLYRLLGMTAAALGKAEAKHYFIVALALDPKLRLDRQLSPKIRAPYLEAQGYWSTHSERLRVEVALSSTRQKLNVALVDPAKLVHRVRLHVRSAGSENYASFVIHPSENPTFELGPEYATHAFEYYVVCLDENGSPLQELGNSNAPLTAPLTKPQAANVRHDFVTRPEERSYVLPAFLLMAGVGSTAAGLAFHLRREDLASDWNGSSCEKPGQSRAEQCESVNSKRQAAERLAIGLYAAGGALFAASIISLVAGRTTQKTDQLALDCQPGVFDLSLRCVGKF